MMTAENFGPHPDVEGYLEVNCSKCLRPISTDAEYVEIFAEKFFDELDEWFALHRHCYEDGIGVVIETLARDEN